MHPHKYRSTTKFIDLDKLKIYEVEDIINKFRCASVLVGMHGAGLINSLFLPNGATLLEVKPFAFDGYRFHRMFSNIARANGVRYIDFVAGPYETVFPRLGKDEADDIRKGISKPDYAIPDKYRFIDADVRLNVSGLYDVLNTVP